MSSCQYCFEAITDESLKSFCGVILHKNKCIKEHTLSCKECKIKRINHKKKYQVFKVIFNRLINKHTYHLTFRDLIDTTAVKYKFDNFIKNLWNEFNQKNVGFEDWKATFVREARSYFNWKINKLTFGTFDPVKNDSSINNAPTLAEKNKALQEGIAIMKYREKHITSMFEEQNEKNKKNKESNDQSAEILCNMTSTEKSQAVQALKQLDVKAMAEFIKSEEEELDKPHLPNGIGTNTNNFNSTIADIITNSRNCFLANPENLVPRYTLDETIRLAISQKYNFNFSADTVERIANDFAKIFFGKSRINAEILMQYELEYANVKAVCDGIRQLIQEDQKLKLKVLTPMDYVEKYHQLTERDFASVEKSDIEFYQKCASHYINSETT